MPNKKVTQQIFVLDSSISSKLPSQWALPGAVDYTLSGDKRLFLYCISSGLWTVPNA